MSEALAPLSAAELVEKVVLGGDLSALNSAERLQYYNAVCNSVGLNPLTRPFEFLVLEGKTVLYAKREATDQLRYLRHITVTAVDGKLVDGVYVVTAAVSDDSGRQDQSTGAVPLVKEQGEWKESKSGKKFFQGNGVFASLSPTDKANAMMKAETKAKRRATLSLCGLGIPDESELDDLTPAAPAEQPRVVSQPQSKSAPEPTPAPPAYTAPEGERPTWQDMRKVWHTSATINETEWKGIFAASKPAGWKNSDVVTLIESNLACKAKEIPNGPVYDLVVRYFSFPPVAVAPESGPPSEKTEPGE